MLLVVFRNRMCFMYTQYRCCVPVCVHNTGVVYLSVYIIQVLCTYVCTYYRCSVPLCVHNTGVVYVSVYIIQVLCTCVCTQYRCCVPECVHNTGVVYLSAYVIQVLCTCYLCTCVYTGVCSLSTAVWCVGWPDVITITDSCTGQCNELL